MKDYHSAVGVGAVYRRYQISFVECDMLHQAVQSSSQQHILNITAQAGGTHAWRGLCILHSAGWPSPQRPLNHVSGLNRAKELSQCGTLSGKHLVTVLVAMLGKLYI